MDIYNSTIMVVTTLLRFIAFYLQLAEALNYSKYMCRYQYHYTAMSWTSARAVCESTNRTLLMIDSSGEMTNITNVIMPHVAGITPNTDPISNTLWIGLHQEVDPVRLLWDDCEEYTVIPGDWSDYVGNLEGCVVFNITDNTYSMQNCSETQPFICEDITEDIVDCYIELPVEFPNISSQIGGDGDRHEPYSLETCSKFCYDDGKCAAFQLKTEWCYKYYYDKSGDFANGRTGDVFYLKNIFTLTDSHPASSPVMSIYYCPEQTTPIQPTTSSSSVSIVSSSEATTTLVYSTDSTVAVLSSTVSSSNGVITSSYVISGTTTSDCYCSCTLTLSSSSITNAELQAKIEQIKTELTVDKKKTSSYKRKLTSAPDNRVSAQSIGYVGVIILSIVVGLLVCIDIPTLAKDTKIFFQRICSPCKRKQIGV